MTAPRPTASLIVGALLRLASREGGFGAVLSKGDEQSGEILVLLAEKGRKTVLLERILQADGNYQWQAIHDQVFEDKEKFDAFLQRRRRFDPDMWLIELDIASAERFAAEMNAVS